MLDNPNAKTIGEIVFIIEPNPISIGLGSHGYGKLFGSYITPIENFSEQVIIDYLSGKRKKHIKRYMEM